MLWDDSEREIKRAESIRTLFKGVGVEAVIWCIE
jgi:hypothetical protein